MKRLQSIAFLILAAALGPLGCGQSLVDFPLDETTGPTTGSTTDSMTESTRDAAAESTSG